MNGFSTLVLPYTVILFIAMAIYVFYVQFTSLRWEESEIRLLERLELHLAHILRLLEAPDMRFLMRRPQARQRLFLEFSACLREDVAQLMASRKISVSVALFAAVFFISYHLMRLKAQLACGRNDLRFLSGLGLAFYRRLHKGEAG